MLTYLSCQHKIIKQDAHFGLYAKKILNVCSRHPKTWSRDTESNRPSPYGSAHRDRY